MPSPSSSPSSRRATALLNLFFKAVPHDLLDLEGAGTLFVAGPTDADHLVLLCAGFPDDHSSLAPLARRLAERGCLVGVCSMPEFEREGPPLRPQGYTLDEIPQAFAQAAAALHAQSTRHSALYAGRSSRATSLSVVVHDWAIYPGLAFANNFGCDKLVLFDVIHATDLMHSASDGTVSLCRPESLRHEAIHLLYWASLGACFFLWRRCAPVGWLCLYTVFFVAWLCPFLSPLGPLDWGGRAFGPTGLRPWQEPNGEATASKAVTPYRCYPYFHALTLFADRAGRRRALANVSLASALKRQPILYVFGEDKNAHWHTEAALDALRQTEGCSVVSVKGAGHWVYKQAPGPCFDAVERFILV